VLQHENILRLDIKRRIVARAARSAERREHHRPALVLEQLRVRRRALEDRALGRQVAEQRDKTRLALEWLLALRDDGAVNKRIGWRGKPLIERLARHGHTIEMQQRLELA